MKDLIIEKRIRTQAITFFKSYEHIIKLSLLNTPFCIFSGIFGDFQLLFQRPMAGTPPAYLRALSSRVELHFTRNHDPGQSGAGQRAVASKYLHL